MSKIIKFLFPNPRYTPYLAGVYCSIAGVTGYSIWNRYQQIQSNNVFNHNLITVQQAFIQSKPLISSKHAENVCGRVKCMKPDELTHLSNHRKPFSWVIGNCGLFNMSQCTNDYDKLMLLGFERDWIHLQLNKGNYFNLYLFPEKSKDYSAEWATWDGIYRLFEHSDTEIYQRILPYKDDIINTPFDDIESKSDFEFLYVEETGPSDPRYLTRDRFLQINKDDLTLVDVRFFFYCYVGLSKYYDGKGFTVDKDGGIGCKEYLIKNMRLNDMKQLKYVKFNVKIPNNES